MLSKALEMDVCFHRDAFLGSLREGINFFIYGKFHKEFERYVKKAL